jgi:hypothetical protein
LEIDRAGVTAPGVKGQVRERDDLTQGPGAAPRAIIWTTPSRGRGTKDTRTNGSATEEIEDHSQELGKKIFNDDMCYEQMAQQVSQLAYELQPHPNWLVPHAHKHFTRNPNVIWFLSTHNFTRGAAA